MAYDGEESKGLQIGRRQFMTWTAGGAYVLGIAGTGAAVARQVGAPAANARIASPWFKITAEGRMVVQSNAVEMGQGSHTGHAALLADELDMPWDKVDVEMVDIQIYNNTVSTGGSRSIVSTYDTARKAGAAARSQFIAAAAKKWGVDPSTCTVAGGRVVNGDKSLGYAELVSDAAAAAIPANVTPKVVASRKVVGKTVRTQKVKSKTDGTMQYGLDVRLPGMMHASVRQSPVFGGKLASVDEAPALAIPGVKKVVKLDDAVAVIATDTFTAFKGIRALKPQWTTPTGELANTKMIPGILDKQIKAKFAETPSPQALSLRAQYDNAPKKVEATYDLAHVAHVTMEPQNCTAHVTADKIRIWGPTQVPTQVVRGAAAAAKKPAGFPVELNTTMLGGGFGRRLMTDYAMQAVSVAATVDYPVQLVWTREEDFAHDFYRRAVRQTYRAGIAADGAMDSYECLTAATDAPVTSGYGQAPYNALKPSATTQAGAAKAGIPQGYWRSVDPGISTFGREGFIDECAVAAGKDPLAFRLALLGDNERAKRVLNTVAEKINWSKKRPAGTGVGIAVADGFGSTTAHAVEVQVKGKKLTVTRIVVASDLGAAIVAPNQVRAQFEGGTLQALGTALVEAMTFTDGKADQQNFDTYQILRHSRAPKIEVHLFETADKGVGGAGEPPVPTLAPALVNAIFAATKKRVRTLPIKDQGFDV